MRGLVVAVHDDHGSAGVMEKRGAGRAEQHAPERAHPAVTDDNHLRGFRRVDEGSGHALLADLGLDRQAVRLAQAVGHHLLGLLDRVAGVFLLTLEHRGHVRASRPADDDRCDDVHQRDRCIVQRRFTGGPPHRGVRLRRAVHTDEDSVLGCALDHVRFLLGRRVVLDVTSVRDRDRRAFGPFLAGPGVDRSSS